MDRKSVRSLISWALYDCGVSAYSANIETFVFAAYFVSSVAFDKTQGVALWGLTMGISGFVVAIGGPILGAFADQGGHRKGWLAFWTGVALLCILLMWFVKPSPAYVVLGLLLVGVASTAVEIAFVFYNAMLLDLAGKDKVGYWSGWGWGIGYVGGILCLALALFLFVNPTTALFHLDRTSAQEIRSTFLLTALWYLLFAVPVFFFTPPPSTSKGKQHFGVLIDNALKQLGRTFKEIRSYSNIFRFLIARMIFSDALITLFAFGGIYAAAAFDMSAENILYFGISLNITAGIGAVLFARLDDIFGGWMIIVAALIGLILASTAALLATSMQWFWIAGMAAGLFVGPVQASSRSYMARVAPKELYHEMFGMFALSSKVTAFLGPLAVSWITYWTGSFRLGMGTIILFLMIGLMLMFTVSKDKELKPSS